MAGIGLSKPYFALYSNSGNTVTYSDGGVLGKATSMSLSLEEGGDNILYADNAPAETDAGVFAGGTVTVGLDRLPIAVAAKIFGGTVDSVATPATASRLDFKSGQTIPYCGLAFIQKKQENNATTWTAWVYYKCQARIPGEEMTTQGDTIEWQTPELEFSLLRDDTADEKWCSRFDGITTEANAEAIIKNLFDIS